MEEEPPWELGFSPYLVKKVKEMKKMEERERERERESEWGGREREEKLGILKN